MILTITLSLIIAAVVGYDLRKLLHEKTLYPFFILEFVLIIFQICTYFGIYIFVPYAAALKTLFMVSMLLPFFKYKLYLQGCIGAGCVLAGTLLNRVAMNANGGKMPVFPSLSYLTGYTRPEMFTSSGDTLHILGDEFTKCKLLTDFIDVGYCVLSIGDLLIRVLVGLMLFATVTRVCEKRKANKDNG